MTMERLVKVEVNVLHNAEAIKNNAKAIGDMTRNCSNVQKEYQKELKGLRDEINNGFKDTIKEAIKENLSGNIMVTARAGLSLSDKIVVAVITVLGSIIVALITVYGGIL